MYPLLLVYVFVLMFSLIFIIAQAITGKALGAEVKELALLGTDHRPNPPSVRPFHAVSHSIPKQSRQFSSKGRRRTPRCGFNELHPLSRILIIASGPIVLVALATTCLGPAGRTAVGFKWISPDRTWRLKSNRNWRPVNQITIGIHAGSPVVLRFWIGCREDSRVQFAPFAPTLRRPDRLAATRLAVTLLRIYRHRHDVRWTTHYRDLGLRLAHSSREDPRLKLDLNNLPPTYYMDRSRLRYSTTVHTSAASFLNTRWHAAPVGRVGCPAAR